jgi:hypothetical protein
LQAVVVVVAGSTATEAVVEALEGIELTQVLQAVERRQSLHYP